MRTPKPTHQLVPGDLVATGAPDGDPWTVVESRPSEGSSMWFVAFERAGETFNGEYHRDEPAPVIDSATPLEGTR